MLQAPLQLSLTPTPSSAQTHLHSTGSYGRPAITTCPTPAFSIIAPQVSDPVLAAETQEWTQTQLHWPTNSHYIQYWSQLEYLLQEATHDYPPWHYGCAQSCPTLCDPMNHSPPGSLSTEFSRREY